MGAVVALERWEVVPESLKHMLVEGHKKMWSMVRFLLDPQNRQES